MFHHAHRGLAEILGKGHLGREQAPVLMSLEARLPRAERTFFPG
jgi:hypothetical protein